jgi:hypothetical protein
MTRYLDTRVNPFTNEEFDAIARNEDGDILDLCDAYPFITEAQRDRLTGDDWSRMQEIDEDVLCELADFM